MNNNSWTYEIIPYLPTGNWLYKTVCFCLGKRKKKLSYQEFYLLLKQINKKSLGEDESKKKSMEKIIEIYKYFHNNNTPN